MAPIPGHGVNRMAVPDGSFGVLHENCVEYVAPVLWMPTTAFDTTAASWPREVVVVIPTSILPSRRHRQSSHGPQFGGRFVAEAQRQSERFEQAPELSRPRGWRTA